MGKKPKYSCLITDVDNTLFDWLSYYIPCFKVMVKKISNISGVNEDEIINSFKKIHEKYRSTEYSFVFQELEALKYVDRKLSIEEVTLKYMPALLEFQKKSNELLVAYPNVASTLNELKISGVNIIALSDSIMTPLISRLKLLNMDQYFTAIYACKNPGIQNSIPISIFKKQSNENTIPQSRLVEIPSRIRKPDPRTLQMIFDDYNLPIDTVVYLGDSLTRDILLAKRCGVVDVWAKYGKNVEENLYNDLLKITYWTQEDLIKEINYDQEIKYNPPSNTIDSFDQILEIFEIN